MIIPYRFYVTVEKENPNIYETQIIYRYCLYQYTPVKLTKLILKFDYKLKLTWHCIGHMNNQEQNHIYEANYHI